MQLTKENLRDFVTREQLVNRTLDALEGHYIPYEAHKVRPYELISRF